jgi:hypothetical protein
VDAAADRASNFGRHALRNHPANRGWAHLPHIMDLPGST